ncbi:MAG: glycine cleavage system aminomethyltransferase GcvT [Christensenellaceae bacterium]
MEKKTPLYQKHEQAGARIVPFAGWLMPVQYSGIIAEHKAVRNAAGLFDVSHMGEIELCGSAALSNIQMLVTRNCEGLSAGQISYSPMCNESGGVVDDILIYKKADDEYLLVVNASNKDKDFAWISDHAFGDVRVKDISDEVAQLALQGPKSEQILKKLTKEIPQKYYTFLDNVELCGEKVLISRTGYTAEDGFELYCAPESAETLWDALLEAGAEYGILPCGLGARDTLRLEGAMPLYGHEMNDEVLPYEAGIGFFVNLDKEDFIGRLKLAQKKETAQKRVGLKILDRGIAREGAPVYAGDKQVGVVTSGTHSPTFQYAIAMARVQKEIPQMVEVEVRGKRLKAEVVKLPFYKREK